MVIITNIPRENLLEELKQKVAKDIPVSAILYSIIEISNKIKGDEISISNQKLRDVEYLFIFSNGLYLLKQKKGKNFEGFDIPYPIIMGPINEEIGSLSSKISFNTQKFGIISLTITGEPEIFNQAIDILEKNRGEIIMPEISNEGENKNIPSQKDPSELYKSESPKIITNISRESLLEEIKEKVATNFQIYAILDTADPIGDTFKGIEIYLSNRSWFDSGLLNCGYFVILSNGLYLLKHKKGKNFEGIEIPYQMISDPINKTQGNVFEITFNTQKFGIVRLLDINEKPEIIQQTIDILERNLGKIIPDTLHKRPDDQSEINKSESPEIILHTISGDFNDSTGSYKWLIFTQNNLIITKNFKYINRSKEGAGALIGGLAGGFVGAMVGGAIGNVLSDNRIELVQENLDIKINKDNLNKMELITVNDQKFVILIKESPEIEYRIRFSSDLSKYGDIRRGLKHFYPHLIVKNADSYQPESLANQENENQNRLYS